MDVRAGTSSDSFTPGGLFANGENIRGGKITLKSGAGALTIGTVLGKIFKGAATSAAKEGGNTGNGTLTMDVTTPLLAGAKTGIYTVRCIARASGTVAAAGSSAAVAGNTGDGTITAAPATGAGAIQGVYTAVCIKAASDAGDFEVRDPTGKVLGRATVGVAFTTHLTFTIADGAADFAVGDAFNITVAGEQDETFRVEDPDGLVVGDFAVSGVSGSATFADQIKFAMADGSTDFIVGDGFDITVAAGTGKFLKSVAAALDGSQEPDAILGEDVDASDADKEAMVYFAGEFNSSYLTLGAGHTVASIKDGCRKKGMFLK